MQTFAHYFLHFGVPLCFALIFFKKDWKKTVLILWATMLVDVDHLLSNPVFVADRCSINFHFLHTYYAMALYGLLLFIRGPLRLVGAGLLFHMLTDFLDCVMTSWECASCLSGSSEVVNLLRYITN